MKTVILLENFFIWFEKFGVFVINIILLNVFNVFIYFNKNHIFNAFYSWRRHLFVSLSTHSI